VVVACVWVGEVRAGGCRVVACALLLGCVEDAPEREGSVAGGVSEGTPALCGALKAVSHASSSLSAAVGAGLGLEGDRAEPTHPTNVMTRSDIHPSNRLLQVPPSSNARRRRGRISIGILSGV
jgi:hypothetical protein